MPTNSHPKIMVAPPRLNLRRAKSYNAAADRPPLSSTSSRFNFNHLLFSPPPSPSLPALVPRPPKRRSSDLLKTRPSRVVRLAVYAITCLTSLYILALAFRHRHVSAIWPHLADQDYEMAAQETLPTVPTPILVRDAEGTTKWTVSVPPKYNFPLSIQEYSEMNALCRETSAQARGFHHKQPLAEQILMNYDTPDEYYIDVHDAQQSGLLPMAEKPRVKDYEHFVGMDYSAMFGKPVCETSMTFILESQDAGMGNALMMLWTLYGLAEQQGRTFFIDDSRWAYGDYAKIFKVPQKPACRPPSRSQIVPCPLQAKHLAVSASTAHEVLPALLAQHHRAVRTEDRVKEVWQLARTGYEALYTLNSEDAKYVAERVETLQDRAKKGGIADAPIVGLHIRHGDQHPLEFQYRSSYIPAEVYLDIAHTLADAHFNRTQFYDGDRQAVTVIASDDPMVLTGPDFSSAVPAQEHIRLASKDNIQEANKDHRPTLHHFIDETFGWEGGFFAPMFWNLGVTRNNNAANAPVGVEIEDINEEARHMATPSEKTLALRSFVGRGYMMDLAVLAEVSDSVVCAVSAMGCRLLGVMMEWEKGVGGEGWVNVDGDYGWTGIN